MRRSSEFTAVVRGGTRVRRGVLVVHHLPNDSAVPQVGLVVGKTVGGSVVRHQVSRRLRAQLAARVDRIPGGSIVVRALPEAAQADSSRLGRDLDAAFGRLGLPSTSAR